MKDLQRLFVQATDKQCPACGGFVDKEAEVCPWCGCYFDDPPQTNSRFLHAVCLLALAVMVLALTQPAHAQTGAHSVELFWDSSVDLNVNYNIYRSAVTGGPYVKLNPSPITELTFTDTNVKVGERWFYVVRAVTVSGIESVKKQAARLIMNGRVTPSEFGHSLGTVEASDTVRAQSELPKLPI